MASFPDVQRPPRRGEPAAAALRYAFRLPALHPFVPEARRRAVARLREWGVPEVVRGDAELVVSELFTNAVLHTRSVEIGCVLAVSGSRLRVEVADEGCRSTERRPRSAGAGEETAGPEESAGSEKLAGSEEPEEENGRGLLLVKALAGEWGVRAGENGHGSVTWADLPYRPAAHRIVP